MNALAWVGVLVEVGAVEEPEAVLVSGEMRGNPIEDDADAVLVERIDEVHEVLGCTETATGREVPGRLVAPRTEERVLHDRQELEVGESNFFDVVHESSRQFLVTERAIVVFRHPLPRT